MDVYDLAERSMRVIGSLKSEFGLVTKNDILNSLVINRDKFVAIMARLMSSDLRMIRETVIPKRSLIARRIGIVMHIVITL